MSGAYWFLLGGLATAEQDEDLEPSIVLTARQGAVVDSGEVLYFALDFSAEPGIVAGATIDSLVSLKFLRDGTEVADVIETPVMTDTQLRFWGDLTGMTRGRYSVRGTTKLSNNETAIVPATIFVQ